eukprot:g25807.t1
MSGYQTVLYGRNRERHGFASQAPRFAPGRASATPGPGCYAAEPEPAELELGALVSEESDRPGPGQYDQVDAEERMRSTQRPSQKRLVHEPLDTETAQLRRGTELLKTLDASPRGTRHDASPRPAEPSGAECGAVPGPGQYDIPRLEERSQMDDV